MFENIRNYLKEYRKIKVYINGLIPSDIILRDNNKGGSYLKIKITKEGLDPLSFYGASSYSNEKGEFIRLVSYKYIGAQINGTISHPYFVKVKIEGIIEDFGYYNSCPVIPDYNANFLGSVGIPQSVIDLNWDTNSRHSEAEKLKIRMSRKFKHKNMSIKILHWVCILLSNSLVFFSMGIGGLFYSGIISLLIIYLTPYSLGIKRG